MYKYIINKKPVSLSFKDSYGITVFVSKPRYVFEEFKNCSLVEYGSLRVECDSMYYDSSECGTELTVYLERNGTILCTLRVLRDFIIEVE